MTRGAVPSACVSVALVLGCATPRGRPVGTTPRDANVAVDTAQRRIVAWTRGPDATSSVPRGEIVGVVVDAETGTPIDHAMVAIVMPGGTVYTDSSGRFRLRVPLARSTMRAMRFGYGTATLDVPARADSGLFATFALRSQPIRLCNVSIGGSLAPGVIVVAHDALMGETLRGTISVVAQDGTYRDSVAAQPNSDGRTRIAAALNRPGHYDVTVRGVGYKPWHGTASTRPDSYCGGFEPATMHAWLVPS